MNSQYHASSILMSSGGDLRRVINIMETSSVRNTTGGFALEPSDANGLAHERVSQSRIYELFPDSETEYAYFKEKISRLELEKAKLVQLNQLKTDDNEDLRQKNDSLRQQLAAANNGNVPGMTGTGVTNDRLDRIENQLSTLLDLVNNNHREESQLNMMVNAVSKVVTFCEDIKNKMTKLEAVVSQIGWVDVHNYQGERIESQTMRETDLYERRGHYGHDQLRLENQMMSSGHNGRFQQMEAQAAPMEVNDDLGANRRIIGDRSAERLASTSSRRMDATTAGGNDNTSVISPINLLDRRQSDSTTITTIESGYYDDREDVFLEDGEQVANGSPSPTVRGHHHQHKGVGDQRAYNSQTMFNGDIEMIGEYTTPNARRPVTRLSSAGEVNPSTSESIRKDLGMVQSQPVDNGGSRLRRPSIFTRSMRPAQYDLDFDDGENTISQRNSIGSIDQDQDQETCSLNGIFESAANDQENDVVIIEDDNSADSESPLNKRKRLSRSGSAEEKRIRGISKAPIKREPGTISVYSARSGYPAERQVPAGPPPQDHNTSQSQAKFMEVLRNIKKERVAHAIDGFCKTDCTWKCICGHKTSTKNGMKLHVKNMGTEDPRYMCPWVDCPRRFLFPFLVRNHLLKEHKDNTVPDKLYGCEKCYKVFYNKNNFKTHRNDRNETCRSTPRRRSYPVRLMSSSDRLDRVSPVASNPVPLTPLVLNPVPVEEDPGLPAHDRPSIIINLN